MSYKIEITADTITELTGKLLALAAATQPGDPVMPEVKEAAKPSRKAKGNAADAPSASTAVGTGSSTTTEAAAEAAEPATSSVDAGNQTTGPASETSTPTSDTSAPSSEATPSEEATTTTEAAPEALDFDKDVAPVVLEAVKQRGKDWVSEILSQFGVARASQVPDEQMAELVATLKDGLK